MAIALIEMAVSIVCKTRDTLEEHSEGHPGGEGSAPQLLTPKGLLSLEYLGLQPPTPGSVPLNPQAVLLQVAQRRPDSGPHPATRGRLLPGCPPRRGTGGTQPGRPPPMLDCQSLTREDLPSSHHLLRKTATPVGWEQLFYNLRTRSDSRESKGPSERCPTRPYLLPGRDHAPIPLFILYLWQSLRTLPKIPWLRGTW